MLMVTWWSSVQKCRKAWEFYHVTSFINEYFIRQEARRMQVFSCSIFSGWSPEIQSQQYDKCAWHNGNTHHTKSWPLITTDHHLQWWESLYMYVCDMHMCECEQASVYRRRNTQLYQLKDPRQQCWAESEEGSTIDDDLGHGCVPGLSWQQHELKGSKLPETRDSFTCYKLHS